MHLALMLRCQCTSVCLSVCSPVCDGSALWSRCMPGRGERGIILFTTIYGNIFTARIVNICNSLPNSVVDANSVNAFKGRFPA